MENNKSVEETAKEAMAKLTPEQRAEVEAFIKEDMAQRQARHDKLQKMTPEQRQAIRANRPLKMHDGKHFKRHKDGKHFQSEGFRGHGPRPDCKIAICPPVPAK